MTQKKINHNCGATFAGASNLTITTTENILLGDVVAVRFMVNFFLHAVALKPIR